MSTTDINNDITELNSTFHKAMMKITEETIDGITYTIRSTTKEGLKRAKRMLKASLKRQKKDNNNEIEGHGV